MLEEMFSETDGAVWSHVVVGFSKCNTHETTWRAKFEDKCTELQTLVKSVTRCTVDVPVLPLGGSELADAPCAGDAATELCNQCDVLWRTISDMGQLDTTRLRAHDGAQWVKLDDLVYQRDANTGAIWRNGVKLAVTTACVGGVVCGANFVLPALFLADEALIIGGAVYLKSRAVGGRAELKRQAAEQAGHWKSKMGQYLHTAKTDGVRGVAQDAIKDTACAVEAAATELGVTGALVAAVAATGAAAAGAAAIAAAAPMATVTGAAATVGAAGAVAITSAFGKSKAAAESKDAAESNAAAEMRS